MNIMNITCDSCAGTGKQLKWNLVNMENNIGTMESTEVVCEVCCGKGYTEYAVFTLEEAKVILKHCGLSTES